MREARDLVRFIVMDEPGPPNASRGGRGGVDRDSLTALFTQESWSLWLQHLAAAGVIV